jgi:hypothetical protein
MTSRLLLVTRDQIEQTGEDTEHRHLFFSIYDGLFNICSNCANAIRCLNDCQNNNWICFYEKMVLCTNLVCPNAWYHAKCVKYKGGENCFCCHIRENTPKENQSKIFIYTLAGNENRKMRLEVDNMDVLIMVTQALYRAFHMTDGYMIAG